ncbi:hypothetical protein [Bacillus kwashiorkori]|uniref:hypothetical protein n=1 Tax=Bacillus kwashiorkori TaxID=1522318 RepID=UPI0007857D01|nr:hypothetical protein [Bacillus kwashiorkori]
MNYNWSNGFSSQLPFLTNNDEINTAKLNEDRYELYVNGDFVGYKTLLNQADDVTDIDSFLKQQGITSFTTELSGDHYLIETADDAEKLKDILKIYCQNR